MNGDFVIIPVREFATGKLRLKNDLSSQKRGALSSALLKRDVRVLEASKAECTIIVASDASEVRSLLSEFSKISVISEDTYHGGVNRAMSTGLRFAIGMGAKTITMLPSDLPIINHSRIDAALKLLQKRELIINASQKKDGTNLLAMSSSLDFRLHYDDNSFVKHLAEAKRRHLNFQLLDWPEFAFDLDDVFDLTRAMVFYKAKDFVDFLDQLSTIEI